MAVSYIQFVVQNIVQTIRISSPNGVACFISHYLLFEPINVIDMSCGTNIVIVAVVLLTYLLALTAKLNKYLFQDLYA